MVYCNRNSLPNLTYIIYQTNNDIKYNFLLNYIANIVGKVTFYFFCKSISFYETIKQFKAIIMIN